MNSKNNISPFDQRGGVLVKSIPSACLVEMYKEKCGLDISSILHNVDVIEQYACTTTGYKYWMPHQIAGNERFYRELSEVWKNYYRDWRWEYDLAKRYVKRNSVCLEIGCGRGFFLRHIENGCKLTVGLEYNEKAVIDKVCESQILNETVESHLLGKNQYDVVFSFQVLEHIAHPKEFLESAINLLKKGGYLVLSTPNDDFGPHLRYEDAFNLPPHHMGSYNDNVFTKIAELLGMDIVEFKIQPCGFDLQKFSYKTEKQFLYRLFGKFVKIFGKKILMRTKEPGHSILCVMRKRT
jgi:2-polyprenyl-3-methyl-5-hydroxy-6-metoxy-1,4-benzoquinol methylase